MDFRIKRLGLIVFAAALAVSIGCARKPPETVTVDPVELETKESEPTSPTPEETPQATTPSGILAIQFGTSTGVSRASVTLVQIDPKTGSNEIWSQFQPPEGVTFSLPEIGLDAYTPFSARRLFSPDYRQIAAQRPDSGDGSQHVGWITSDGGFVDVTEAVAPEKSEFANPARHGSPQFGVDGMFYYLDEDSGDINKVDPGNLGPSSVVKIADGKPGPGATFDVYPNGTISAHFRYEWPDRIENTAANVFGVRRVEDWLDAKTYLTADWDVQSGISGSRGQIYATPALTGKPDGRSELKGKAVLPEDTQRANWNPISSPDGQQVAFLSAAKGQAAPELFTVSRDVGDPTIIATDYTFFIPSLTGDNSNTYRLQLLDWL